MHDELQHSKQQTASPISLPVGFVSTKRHAYASLCGWRWLSADYKPKHVLHDAVSARVLLCDQWSIDTSANQWKETTSDKAVWFISHCSLVPVSSKARLTDIRLTVDTVQVIDGISDKIEGGKIEALHFVNGGQGFGGGEKSWAGRPLTYSPMGPLTYSPMGPLIYSPMGPLTYSPWAPLTYSPMGPLTYSRCDLDKSWGREQSFGFGVEEDIARLRLARSLGRGYCA